jgi:hypothetical protein
MVCKYSSIGYDVYIGDNDSRLLVDKVFISEDEQSIKDII